MRSGRTRRTFGPERWVINQAGKLSAREAVTGFREIPASARAPWIVRTVSS